MAGMFRLLLVLLILISVHPPCSHARNASEEMRSNIGKLQESIQEHQDKLARSADRERSLFEELQRLDASLDEQRTQLEVLQTRQAEMLALIAAKKLELAKLNEQHQHLQQHLIKRLQAYYLLGKTGLFNALFASQSLAELVRNNGAFHSLVTYDRAVFLRFRKSTEEINTFQQTLEQEQSRLDQLIHEAGEKEQKLLLALEEQNRFLQRVQTERGLYEQALREMEKAQRKLTVTMTRLAKDKKKRSTQGFAHNKGKLPPPLHGPLVRGFMEPGSVADAAPFAHGITIGVDAEQEVRAVYSGVVIYAGYMPGYGKIVIIEHAQQYYTVTAKFAKINVGEKNRVTQGQVLGTTDSFATLVGKGLYFEIRHGAIAEDPLSWLKPGSIVKSLPES